MNYEVPFTIHTILLSATILFVAPIVLTCGAEYLFTKKLTLGVTSFVVIIGLVFFTLGVIQITTSKVVLNDDSLILKSLVYTNKTMLKDVELTSGLHEASLPASFRPVLRENGVGLFGYNAGTFKLNDGTSGFVMLSKPPYLVLGLKGHSGKLIFSANAHLYEALKSHLVKLTYEKITNMK